MQQKFKALSRASKIGLIATVIVILGAISSATTHPKVKVVTQNSATKSVLGTETAQPQTITPVATTSTQTETQTIPFTSSIVNDATLPSGQTKLLTAGVSGTESIIYKVTITNGQETSRQLIDTVVIQQPVSQVTAIGTYVAPKPAATASNCDPNYSGACVPNVYPSDVDCTGGSGNGPYYAQGPIQVVGTDHYGLDRDGDGIACE